MATQSVLDLAPEWVPSDTFGARLALIRVKLGGWNVKKTAHFCGIDDQTWRNWEAGKLPRNYEEVCQQISDKVGCDVRWLKAGGPLRSRCLCPTGQIDGQLSLLAAGRAERELAAA